MSDTELRVNAMMAEYRQTIIALADRATLLAVELATTRAALAAEIEKHRPISVPDDEL